MPGEIFGRGRRIRLRQVHARQDHHRHPPADRGRASGSRAATSTGWRRPPRARRAPQPAILPPGPRRVARSALEDRPLAATSRWSIHTRSRRGRAREARIREILDAVGLPAHASRSLSARDFRRPAAPGRPCAHPHAASEPGHPRRADVGPRRVGAGDGAVLFRGLRETFDLTYILISHDLSVVRMMCRPRRGDVSRPHRRDRADRGDLRPRRGIPTRARCSRPFPRSAARASPRFLARGRAADPGNLPSGCRFRTRCPKAADLCAREEPALSPLAPGSVACHFPD